jgi:hypothetical protein
MVTTIIMIPHDFCPMPYRGFKFFFPAYDILVYLVRPPQFFIYFVPTFCVEMYIVLTLLSVVTEADNGRRAPTTYAHETGRHRPHSGGIKTYPREGRPATVVVQGKCFAHTLVSSAMAF